MSAPSMRRLTVVAIVVLLIINGYFLWTLIGNKHAASTIVEDLVREEKVDDCSSVQEPYSVVLVGSDGLSGSIILNKTKLVVDRLASLGYWKENAVINYRNLGGGQTVRRIEIEMIPLSKGEELSETYYQQKTPNGGVIVAIATKVNNCVQRVTIGFGEAMHGLSRDLVERQLNAAFWNAIYMSTQYRGLPVDVNSEVRKQFISENMKSGVLFSYTKN